MKKIILTVFTILALVLAGCSSGSAHRSLNEIRRSGVLRVYVSAAGAPFAFLTSDGRLEGSEVLMATTLAERLGVSPEFVLVESAQLFNSVQSGEADIAIGMIIDTSSARNVVMFTNSTGSQGMYAVARSEYVPNTCGMFEGKRVGVVSGSATEYALIISSVYAANIVYYESAEYAEAGLLNGECDVFICSELEAANAIARNNTLSAEYVVNAAEVEFSAMTARRSADLVAIANAVIAEME